MGNIRVKKVHLIYLASKEQCWFYSGDLFCEQLSNITPERLLLQRQNLSKCPRLSMATPPQGSLSPLTVHALSKININCLEHCFLFDLVCTQGLRAPSSNSSLMKAHYPTAPKTARGGQRTAGSHPPASPSTESLVQTEAMS